MNVSINSNPSPNELHLLRFHEDMNELGTDFIFEHATGEVTEINPYPGDPLLVLTCGANGVKADAQTMDHQSKALLWKMPPPPDYDYVEDPATSTVMEPRASPLEESLSIPIQKDSTWHCSIWNNPEEKEMDLITLTSSTSRDNPGHNIITLSQWDLQYGTPDKPIYQTDLPIDSTPIGANNLATTSPKVTWDPHNTHLVAFSHGPYVSIYDLRTDPKNKASMNIHSSDDTPTKTNENTDPNLTTSSSSNTTSRRKRRYHRYNVTGLDYNPNRPHIMVTGGEDGLLKFWDLRTTSSSSHYPYNTSSSYHYSSNLGTTFYSPHRFATSDQNRHNNNTQRPIQICRGGHSHWTTSVKYNPFHDQLILSSGTDSIVNLWRISSISSSPLLELDTTTSPTSRQLHSTDDIDFGNDEVDVEDDALINEDDDDDKSINDGPDIRVVKVEHQDCVYDVAWSKCDAWVWASVGLDGGVILSHVPSKEKYKILL